MNFAAASRRSSARSLDRGTLDHPRVMGSWVTPGSTGQPAQSIPCGTLTAVGAIGGVATGGILGAIVGAIAGSEGSKGKAALIGAGIGGGVLGAISGVSTYLLCSSARAVVLQADGGGTAGPGGATAPPYVAPPPKQTPPQWQPPQPKPTTPV